MTAKPMSEALVSIKLAALERRFRFLKWVGIIAVLVLLGAVGYLLLRPTVGAKTFALADEQGNLRALFDVHEGQPRIRFLDDRGTAWAALRANESNRALELVDASGATRLALVASEKQAGLVASEATSKVSVTLGVLEGTPGLVLLNSAGTIAAVLRADDKSASLELADLPGPADEKPDAPASPSARALLSAARGVASLALNDGSDTRRALLEARTDEPSGLRVFSPTGAECAALASTADGPRLALGIAADKLLAALEVKSGTPALS
ncbi:MAG: hypothetical protein WBD14_04760, partial [Phycisphaerae bacterium]